MSYLINLITPENGIVLDCFMGSGSTIVSCIQNGFRYIGIEKDPQYYKIAKARIEYALKEREKNESKE
jgi:site-specific DNA-methyltransferase (adenine-specific)